MHSHAGAWERGKGYFTTSVPVDPKIHNGGHFVEWDCDANFSADTVEARWENISGKAA